jgi:FkbM family methyltransferase
MLALSFLRSNDVVWDVGGSIGYTALIFAHAVGERGKVFALEPSRISFPMLQSTTRREQVSALM